MIKLRVLQQLSMYCRWQFVTSFVGSSIAEDQNSDCVISLLLLPLFLQGDCGSSDECSGYRVLLHTEEAQD